MKRIIIILLFVFVGTRLYSQDYRNILIIYSEREVHGKIFAMNPTTGEMAKIIERPPNLQGDVLNVSCGAIGFLVVGWGEITSCPDALNSIWTFDILNTRRLYQSSAEAQNAGETYVVPYVVDFSGGIRYGQLQRPRPRPFYCAEYSYSAGADSAPWLADRYMDLKSNGNVTGNIIGIALLGATGEIIRSYQYTNNGSLEQLLTTLVDTGTRVYIIDDKSLGEDTWWGRIPQIAGLRFDSDTRREHYAGGVPTDCAVFGASATNVDLCLVREVLAWLRQ
jgi:hypothetical protein